MAGMQTVGCYFFVENHHPVRLATFKLHHALVTVRLWYASTGQQLCLLEGAEPCIFSDIFVFKLACLFLVDLDSADREGI